MIEYVTPQNLFLLSMLFLFHVVSQFMGVAAENGVVWCQGVCMVAIVLASAFIVFSGLLYIF